MRLANCLLLLAVVPFGSSPAAGFGAAQRGSSQDRPGAGQGVPEATVSIDTRGDGCAVRWNGEAVSLPQLGERGRASVQARLPHIPAGTSTESPDAPHMLLESPADAPWSCVGPVVEMLRSARFGSILLRIAGSGPSQDLRAPFIFSVPGLRFEYAIVEVAGRGRLRLNGRPLDLPSFPEAYLQAAVRLEFAGMLGDAVVPRPAARFVDVYEAFRVLGALRGRSFLSNCRDAAPPQGVSLRC